MTDEYEDDCDVCYSSQHNIANHPEAFGLEIVAEFYDPDACYDFDTFIVWKDKAGSFYYAGDSGCSCPTPFEDYRSVKELARVRTLHQLERAVDEWLARIEEQYDNESNEYKRKPNEDLRKDVKKLLETVGKEL
jgi:hypothetical protein